MDLEIVDFAALSLDQREHAARVLREAMAATDGAYGADGEAQAQVESFFTDPERSALAALHGDTVVGWVGLIESYSHAWELHPLVVDPSRQRQGVGAALTAALETRAKARGALTLYLGTDDAFGGSNLFGRALFPDVAGKIAGIAETRGHPWAFYRKQGYEVVGLIPDANGPGKPDILMAKKL